MQTVVTKKSFLSETVIVNFMVRKTGCESWRWTSVVQYRWGDRI